LKNKISSEPTNLTFKYELAEFYKKSEMIEECLEVLIEMMKADKNWEDKKANKFILAIFKELGNTSPLTQKYRKLMQRVMY
jgi:thioredoxin-like negative regulator of GroEL